MPTRVVRLPVMMGTGRALMRICTFNSLFDSLVSWISSDGSATIRTSWRPAGSERYFSAGKVTKVFSSPLAFTETEVSKDPSM